MFSAQLHGEVLAAQEEASRLRTERERYEDAMKKAFMRGVCALNMEAMSMFQPGETGAWGGVEGWGREGGAVGEGGESGEGHRGDEHVLTLRRDR